MSIGRPSLTCALVCRWPISVHSEVVLLHRTARLLIRCWEEHIKQEDVSFLYAVGFLWFCSVSIYFFAVLVSFLNASSVDA